MSKISRRKANKEEKEKLTRKYYEYRSIRWIDTAAVAKFPKQADPKWSLPKLRKMWKELFRLYAKQAWVVYGKYKG